MSESALRQWFYLVGLGTAVMTAAVIVVLLVVQLSAAPAAGATAAGPARIQVRWDGGNPSRCVDPCRHALQAVAGSGAQRAA